MQERIRKETTCCFTGHRPEKLSAPQQKAIWQLESAIQEAITGGYDTFISGMAKGVDIWAAEQVLMEKKANRRVRLICAVPYKGFGLHWGGGWTQRFLQIVRAADKVVYICPQYSIEVFQARNIWMVDHSSMLIAAYNGTPGGTRNTILYAQSKPDCEIKYLPL